MRSSTLKENVFASPSEAHPIWVRVGTLFDGDTFIRDAHLVYDAARIRYVGTAPPPADEFPSPQVELPDHTAVPGLIEAHAHLFLDDRARLESLARLGIAAVRDGGDKHGVGLALARESGGAFVESPGAAVYREGGYGSFLGEPLERYETPEACVEARIREGASHLKLMVSGIVDFKKGAVTVPPQMSAAEVAALASAAKRRGMRTMAHASGVEGIQNAIEGGVDTVEHGFFITPEQLARMRDRAQAWVPTFAPVQAQIDHATELGWDEKVVSNLRRIVDGHAESLRRACALGVTILAGSDAGSCGVPHGRGLLSELEHLERAGMAPEAVLHAATGASAGLLRSRVGRLRAGYRTRFFFAGENLKKAKLVVFDGRVWESDGL
jgi:imidazolonepropionase-like amidohydrolase